MYSWSENIVVALVKKNIFDEFDEEDEQLD